jgi:CheY-like chemotaxis protein
MFLKGAPFVRHEPFVLAGEERLLRDKVVLVVDDWEIDRIRVVERLRSGLDARYVVAPDGVAALEVIEREKPDLVITDLMMPRMDGLRLVEHIRKRYSFLPSVLITSSGSEDTAARALEAGAVNYVPKQDMGRLVDTVIGVLELSIGYRQQERLRGYWHHTESLFCLDNEVGAIPVVVSHLQQQASSMRCLDDTESFRLGVALHEALRNAVEHGNLELSSELRDLDSSDETGGRQPFYKLADQRRKQDPFRTRRVHVNVHESSAQGTYTIRDEGLGFDPSALPDPTDPENLLKRSGRGIMLIRTFMDDVVFNETGNEITMTHRYQRAMASENDDGDEKERADAALARSAQS